jgi:peptidoglycan hydrolase-like protein with peptidoglycan-binding domain
MRLKRKMIAALVASAVAVPVSFTSAAEQPRRPAAPKAAAAPKAGAVSKPAKPKGAGSDQVKAVQAALNKQGAALKEDGVFGNKTRAALQKFQKANGLKITGRMDQPTLDKLGVAAAAAAPAAPKAAPAPKATIPTAPAPAAPKTKQ